MCNVHFILTLTPPWLQVKVEKYFDFWNLDVWLVAVCVRFSYETTWPISPMMIPINSGNNVDVQHALHFDLHPSMTAGQGYKILQFCEFRLLPWHECWYMSGPYKVAGDRLDLVITVINELSYVGCDEQVLVINHVHAVLFSSWQLLRLEWSTTFWDPDMYLVIWSMSTMADISMWLFYSGLNI